MSVYLSVCMYFFSCLKVVITTTKHGISVKGPKSTIQLACSEIEKMIRQVFVDRHVITAVGMPQHFASGKGNSNFQLSSK